MSIEAMKQALEALENASEYIQAEHDQRKEMYEPYGMVHKYSTEAQNLLDNKQAITSLRQAIEQAEKQEKALQSLHNENERLGLYKDAYGKPEKCTYPNCPYPCMDLPDCIEQEPAARAWDEGYRFGVNDERMSEANIGIAGMGMKVEPARNNPYRTTPPQRTEQEPVIDKSAAVRIATALGWEPKREWVGLTDEDWVEIFGNSRTIGAAVRNTEAKLKEMNT